MARMKDQPCRTSKSRKTKLIQRYDNKFNYSAQVGSLVPFLVHRIYRRISSTVMESGTCSEILLLTSQTSVPAKLSYT